MDIPTKSKFPRARDVAYLDTAAEGLPPEDAAAALAEYFSDKASGSPGRPQHYRAEVEAVEAAAGLLGAAPRHVALLSSCSEGLNLLANSIAWRPGDEVLIDDLEFSSNVVAWLRLRHQGVRVHVIASEDGILRCESFTSRLSASTRVVSISQVSYKTGTQAPFLAELSRAVHQAGAIFCLDATQALGRVPVSLEGVDYLVASSYKWLLGVHGLGVVYLSPQLEASLTPGAAGWYSVRNIFTADRFERFTYKDGAARLLTGMPNFPSIYALRASLAYLREAGVERIDRALKPLVRRLREGLAETGLPLLTPPDPQYASGIVSFAHPDAPAIGAALEEEGVIVWAGDGRVRASVHLYNDAADIDRLLGALRRILDRQGVVRA
ncbi:MAG TPA: aminotransferase class V-fold PLP-dependent enzyme [Bryobacteraceae bacterium]|nr:aminotransferase class V-fold PLP-dependent enzyme [Bryobacteraceae bacterium]